MLLNNLWIKRVITGEIRKHLEKNETENTTYQNVGAGTQKGDIYS